MEAGEEKSGNINLKRQRAPLSDSEENFFLPSEVNDGQKRRRLGAEGQENCSPKPSSSLRLAELERKPDTPIVPSVRSRVQQLTQRQDGNPTISVAAGGAPLAQRCLSDPGAGSPSLTIHEKSFREPLLGEGEFNQRMERFKVPVFQASPASALNSAKHCTRTCSDFVSEIQQKLQATTTPSSKQASRIREERKQELSLLQPISKNAWLKRSVSDPSLIQQVDGNAEMIDGSFTEALTSDAEKQSSDRTGEMALINSEGPATSAELQNSEGQLQMQREENTLHCEEVREENKHQASVENEEKHLGSQQSQTRTVLKLSFSEDQSFSRGVFYEAHNVSELPIGDEQSLLESTHAEESNMKETVEVSKETEQVGFEEFSFEEVEETDGHSYSEEEDAPSTDDELRLWRYPQDGECKEEEFVVAEEQQEDMCAKEEEEGLESSRVEKEKGGSAADGSKPSDIHKGKFLSDVSAVIAGSSKMQEDKKLRAEGCEHESESCLDECVKDQSALNRESSEGCYKKILTSSSDTDGSDGAEAQLHHLTEAQASDHHLETKDMEQDAVDERQGFVDGLKDETHRAEGGDSSKKVTFLMDSKLINDSIIPGTNTSMEFRAETSMSDAELSSHDETNTAEIINQMFEEVLEYAERIKEENVNDVDTEDHDSRIGACSGAKDKLDTESMKEKSKEEEETREEDCDKNDKLDSNGDELLTFPPSGILSPLSKSVEAVVTPLRLAVSQESNPPSLLLTPEETPSPPAESAPLYSIDAYRTQRRNRQPTNQGVTPGVQRRVLEKSKPQPSVNTKEKIAALNEEAAKLQTVINQTLQALSCCTDEEHGRGSLEEAEAEKLLLVSCEKRSALLAEVTRLKEEKKSASGEKAVEDRDCVSQQPCRGTVSIKDIRLPLKVEFVCSSHNKSGRPSHYFFVLIRYGPCNIVATPLATAADAKNGDTISFPTSVTLKDIRASFEIDVEVYSLSHTSSSNCSSMDRTTTKSWVTPKKLLNTITKSNLTSAAPPALNARRSSNFCLVGSHKITLASLGHSKFPLDKMKLEGKIRRLLGDEFQQKVPFLSPLEGDIYLRLDSESHSNIQHQGFLTMFELISGFGVWHRRYFVLEGCNMYYWNHPNDKETKEAEGSISLSSSPCQSVRPVKRDSCARPFTFELVSSIAQQQQDDSQEPLAKCWFSADNKQEQLDWMDKLNQVLLDFNTWNRTWN